MSYLPLAHIYERVMTCGFISQGIAIGFYRCFAYCASSKDQLSWLAPRILLVTAVMQAVI